jgi:hypothetical protein
MTIHDELILELIKPDRQHRPTGYIKHIVGEENPNSLTYVLEELFHWRGHYEQIQNTFVPMTPDVVVTSTVSGKRTAIEMEGDTDWDFANSLRQVKKYRNNSKDFNKVMVIIPKKYERFAILYGNEGFPVYLWTASRIWECRCKEEIEDTRTNKPKCKKCNSTEMEFKGITNVKFEPFEYPSK